MRLGVLDVGSNTVHLLVVDAHRGAHPWPAYSEKSVLRLAERIGPDGRLSDEGADALVDAAASASKASLEHGAQELMAFATSAVREATNAAEVLDRVQDQAHINLQVLRGEDEARMTFLAVRRWFGWSAGTLLVLDIGGGSLEIAAGIDEEPAVALSLPLGAGRLTRERLRTDPPSAEQIAALHDHVDRVLDDALKGVNLSGFDRVAATSKTFRTLARLAGSAPSAAGMRAPRTLNRDGLRQVLGFIRHIGSAALGEMEGVSANRSHQLVAGGVVAEATMDRLDVTEVDICPWALREGVILQRLDALTTLPH